MTTFTIANLLGASSYSYQDKLEPHPGIDQLRQDLKTAKKSAESHLKNLKGPEKEECLRLVNQAEEMLHLMEGGKTFFENMTKSATHIIKTLNSLPKTLPVSRESAKSRLSSAREKIATTNLPSKASNEKEKRSYQVVPTQTKKSTPNAPEKARASVATSKKSVRASADDTVSFPSREELSQCLSEHPLTNDDYLKEKGINEAAAEFFANSTRKRDFVQVSVIGILCDSDKHSNNQHKLPSAAMGTMKINLTQALQDCAKGTHVGNAQIKAPETETAQLDTPAWDLGKIKYSLTGAGMGVPVAVGGQKAMDRLERLARGKLEEAGAEFWDMNNKYNAAVERGEAVTMDQEKWKKTGQNLDRKRLQWRIAKGLETLVKTPLRANLVCAAIITVGVATDIIVDTCAPERESEKPNEPRSDLIA